MKRRRKNDSFFLKIAARIFAFLMVLLVFIVSFTDGLVRPVVLGYAEKLAEVQATKVINGGVQKVLSRSGFEYAEYVEILKDEQGNITAITADTMALNMLISQIVLTVQQDISGSGRIDVSIPVGNLTGSAYFIGRGPSLPMSVSVSTAVKHSVTSEFSDAGVNQTLHRMVLHLTTSAYAVVPFYTASTTAEVQIPLAETVIVGKVPDAYTVVIEGTNSDLSGKIFDFSAGAG